MSSVENALIRAFFRRYGILVSDWESTHTPCHKIQTRGSLGFLGENCFGFPQVEFVNDKNDEKTVFVEAEYFVEDEEQRSRIHMLEEKGRWCTEEEERILQTFFWECNMLELSLIEQTIIAKNDYVCRKKLGQAYVVISEGDVLQRNCGENHNSH